MQKAYNIININNSSTEYESSLLIPSNWQIIVSQLYKLLYFYLLNKLYSIPIIYLKTDNKQAYRTKQITIINRQPPTL